MRGGAAYTQADWGFNGIFLVFPVIFRCRVRVMTIVPKRIRVRVRHKVREFRPKFGLISGLIWPKSLTQTLFPNPKTLTLTVTVTLTPIPCAIGLPY